MSTITQARLAPIAQRYISMSFRRHDWNEKLATLDFNRSTAGIKFSHNDKDACHPTSRGSRCSFTKPHRLHHVIRKRDCPCRGTDYPICELSSASFISMGYGHGDKNVVINKHHQHETRHDISIHQTHTYLSQRQELSSLDKYLLEIKRRSTMLNVFDALTIPKASPSFQCDLPPRCWKHERSKERESDNNHQDSFHQKPFYAFLAVLGLFRKPTESEIEDGQAQLTDEQKMKKMKPVELKIAKGVLFMCDQEFSRADQLFHEALHIAQDEDDEDRENLILNLIASNYFESGDLDKAEKLFIEIMKRMIAQNVAPTASPILELSLKLASIYSKNPATHEKALKGFKFVISSLLHNLEDIANNIENLDIQSLSANKRDELALLGWSYDWFAKHLLAINDYGGAADMLQRAVQISSLVLGPLHDQTLILLNDIGTTLAMNNSPEDGKIFIRKAVEGAIAIQSNELASFYVNLGLVNLKLNKLDEAMRYCEFSTELAKKNRDHYNTQEVIELSRTCLNEVRRLLDVEGQ